MNLNYKAIIDDLKEAGVSLREVSRATSVDVSYLSRVYHGRSPLSLRVARLIVNVYQLSPDDKERLLADANIPGVLPHERKDLLARLT
jgi:transcriptional regulator with XRE-family HTH domain